MTDYKHWRNATGDVGDPSCHSKAEIERLLSKAFSTKNISIPSLKTHSDENKFISDLWDSIGEKIPYAIDVTLERGNCNFNIKYLSAIAHDAEANDSKDVTNINKIPKNHKVCTVTHRNAKITLSKRNSAHTQDIENSIPKVKLPYFPLYTGDWKKDPQLSLCSALTRGVWIDALAAMHDANRCGILTGTAEQLSRLLRCTADEVRFAANELKHTKTADVTERNGEITLINRRMYKEYKSRECNKYRQMRYRSKADVTPNETACSAVISSSLSISVSKEEGDKSPSSPPTPSPITPEGVLKIYEAERGPLMPVRVESHSKLEPLVECLNKMNGDPEGIWTELVKKASQCHKDHRSFINPYFFAKDPTRIDQVMNGMYDHSFERDKYGQSTKFKRSGKGDASEFGRTDEDEAERAKRLADAFKPDSMR